jgi:hypothetical protein
MKRNKLPLFLFLLFFIAGFSISQPTEVAVSIEKDNYIIRQGDHLKIEVLLTNQTSKKVNLPLVQPSLKMENRNDIQPISKVDSENNLDADLEIYFSKTKNDKFKKIEYSRPYSEAPKSAYPDPLILIPGIKKVVKTTIPFGFIYKQGFYKLKLVYPYYFENNEILNKSISNWIFVTVK